MIVERDGGRLLARTDEAGAFRALVEHDCKTLRLMPGWLSDHELAHYVNQEKSLEIALPVTDQQEISLGKIDFVESDSQTPLSVQVKFSRWYASARRKSAVLGDSESQTRQTEGEIRFADAVA